MITENEIDRLNKLRKNLFNEIAKELEVDGHCKSYEGAFEIGLPNFFEEEDKDLEDGFALILHCYVIGPSRHYTWVGGSLTDCLDKAEPEIYSWMDD